MQNLWAKYIVDSISAIFFPFSAVIISVMYIQRGIFFTLSPRISIDSVLFTPTNALFHTTIYQSFKLY